MSIIPLPPGTTDLASLASLDSNTLLVQVGNQTVTGTLGQSGLANGIDIVSVLPGSSVSFSSASGGALVATILTTIKHQGSGGVFKYQPATTSGVTCPRIQNIGGAQFSLVSGPANPVVRVEQGGSGRIDIDDSTEVTSFYICSGSADILYRSEVITTLVASGGSLTIARPVTTMHVGGSASVFVGRSDGVTSSLPTATTVNCYGGRLTWQGGNITTLNLYGGTVDFSNVPLAMTIGTLNGMWNSVAASRLKSSGSTNLVTITTKNIFGGPIDDIAQ